MTQIIRGKRLHVWTIPGQRFGFAFHLPRTTGDYKYEALIWFSSLLIGWKYKMVKPPAWSKTTGTITHAVITSESDASFKPVFLIRDAETDKLRPMTDADYLGDPTPEEAMPFEDVDGGDPRDE